MRSDYFAHMWKNLRFLDLRQTLAGPLLHSLVLQCNVYRQNAIGQKKDISHSLAIPRDTYNGESLGQTTQGPSLCNIWARYLWLKPVLYLRRSWAFSAVFDHWLDCVDLRIYKQTKLRIWCSFSFLVTVFSSACSHARLHYRKHYKASAFFISGSILLFQFPRRRHSLHHGHIRHWLVESQVIMCLNSKMSLTRLIYLLKILENGTSTFCM